MRQGISTRRAAWTIAALAAFAGLAGCDSVSDTGYTGTWARESGTTQSIITIAPEGDGYSFCWSREATADGRGRHVCASPGTTEVYSGPDLIYVFEFEVERREGSDHLFVTVNGTPKDNRSTPMHYVDRLELQPGGLALWSYQIELNRQPREHEPEPYRFTKISDSPS